MLRLSALRVMFKEKEKVLGGLEVAATLQLGKEHLFLLFTQKRLILAHQAKIGRGSMALSGLLGGLAGGLGKGGEKTTVLKSLGNLPPESILTLHKDNFAVDYDHVVSLAVERGGYDRAAIVLVTTHMKVEMSASLAAVQGVREMMVARLDGKLSLRF